jgi:hypothetical protein
LKDVILGVTNMPNLKYEVDTKLRKGQGTSSEVIGTIKAGAVGKIQDGPRIANGYNWYDVAFGREGSKCYNTGWAIEGKRTDEDVTCLDGLAIDPVQPPELPCEVKLEDITRRYNDALEDLSGVQAMVKQLETKNEKLSKELEELYNNNLALTKDVLRLEKVIQEKNAKIGELRKEIEMLKKAMESSKNIFIELWNTFLKAIGLGKE